MVFPVAAVTSDFSSYTDNWNNSHQDLAAEVLAMHGRMKNFTRLDNIDCMARYVNPLDATSELVIVSKNVTTGQNNGSSLIVGWISGSDSTIWNDATQWVCSGHENGWSIYCTLDLISKYADNWIVIGGKIATWIDVQYCLVGDSGSNTDKCGLHYNASVMVLVPLFTLVMALVIAWVALRYPEPTLVTCGDAIADFLDRPDSVTKNLVNIPTATKRCRNQFAMLAYKPWKQKRALWFSAAPVCSWVLTIGW